MVPGESVAAYQAGASSRRRGWVLEAGELVVDLVVGVAAPGLVERAHGTRFAGARTGEYRGACTTIHPLLPNDPILTPDCFGGLLHLVYLLDALLASLAVAEAKNSFNYRYGKLPQREEEVCRAGYADRDFLKSQYSVADETLAGRNQLKDVAAASPSLDEGVTAALGVFPCLPRGRTRLLVFLAPPCVDVPTELQTLHDDPP